VHFVVTLTAEGKKQVDSEGLEKVFKVVSKVNTSNMVCFDPQGKIKKYATPEDIVADFYDVRLEYYHKRKKHLVGELELVHERLSNQARFIQLIISRELVVSNRKRADVVAELRKRNFRPFPKVAKAHVAGDVDEAEHLGDEEDADAQPGADSDYDYLLGMAIYSLTAEKVARLLEERDARQEELEALLQRSVQDLWRADLDAFMEHWEVRLSLSLSLLPVGDTSADLRPPRPPVCRTSSPRTPSSRSRRPRTRARARRSVSARLLRSSLAP